MTTKRLAKELGLLRQRRQAPDDLMTPVLSNQIFSFLIVLDFESTCWREKSNFTQEIIEFPAVLLDTSTGDVLSEFHCYVQPQEHPVLSDFCTELTGITQMQVEAGVPLQICLSQFSRWLQKLQLSVGLVFPNAGPSSAAAPPPHRQCTFVTWSDWDLGVCLQYECKRKQLHKPDVLNSWIDLRRTYRLFYHRKPKGLKGALQDLGIQFAGREHSGLDDARNTAQLTARMMRDGCVMKITRNLMPLKVKAPLGATAVDEKDLTKTPPKPCLSGPGPEGPGQEAALICHSLISPKTLLNGSWGTSVSPEPPLVLRHLEASSSLVLCPTTVVCLARDRYDDVVLEDNHNTCRMFHVPPAGQVTVGHEDRVRGLETSRESSVVSSEETDSKSISCLTEPQTVERRPEMKMYSQVRDMSRGLHQNPEVQRPLRPGGAASIRRSVLASQWTEPRLSFVVFSGPEKPLRVSSSSASSGNRSALSSLSVNSSWSLAGSHNVTSPLCSCGRRAKRQLVSNGGPNHGRGFYCCPARRSAVGGLHKRCDFFKWESALRRSSWAVPPAGGTSATGTRC